MARTKQTARKAKEVEEEEEVVEVKRKAPAKKVAKKPSVPGDAVVRRIAKQASEEGKSVLTEAFPVIRALLIENYNKYAGTAIETLLKSNKRIEKKGGKAQPTKNAGFSLLEPIFADLGDDDVAKEVAKEMVHCNNPSKIDDALAEDKICLYMSRGAFKKYLIMGSDDGAMVNHFDAKLAPKIEPKKKEGGKAKAKAKAVPRGVGFTFRKEFLNGLQWAIETATANQIMEAWGQMDDKKKRLTYDAFEAADLARVPRPEPKKPRKAPAKKAGGRKAKEADKAPAKKGGRKTKAPVKKAGGRKKKAADSGESEEL